MVNVVQGLVWPGPGRPVFRDGHAGSMYGGLLASYPALKQAKGPKVWSGPGRGHAWLAQAGLCFGMVRQALCMAVCWRGYGLARPGTGGALRRQVAV